jgi:antitoxin VapB
MTTAKVFQSGNSQAVRLPKEFRFNTREVEIYRRGNEVVMREKAQSLSRLLEDLPPWPDDFVEPSDTPPQEREVP